MGKRIKLEDYLKKLKPYKIQNVAVPEGKLITKEDIKILQANVSPRLGLIITFLYHMGLN